MTLLSLRTRTWLVLSTLALGGCGGGDRYQGMDAATLYHTARTEFDEGDYDNAISALDRLLLSSQTFDSLPEARYLLASSYFEKGEYITARSEYQRFLDRYVGHPLSAAASLGMCRSLSELVPNPQRDQTFTREAITVCGSVIVDYAGSDEALEAAQLRGSLREVLAEKNYQIAQGYARRKQWDPAIIYYQIVVDNYPESGFASQALLGIYRANDAIGYDDLAEEARTRLMREYSDSEAAAELRSTESDP